MDKEIELPTTVMTELILPVKMTLYTRTQSVKFGGDLFYNQSYCTPLTSPYMAVSLLVTFISMAPPNCGFNLPATVHM